MNRLRQFPGSIREPGVFDGLVDQARDVVHALLGIAAIILAGQQLAELDRDLVVGEAGPQRHVGLRGHDIVDGPLRPLEMARGAGADRRPLP